jgi:DNA-binding transcriptional LysR family regulator
MNKYPDLDNFQLRCFLAVVETKNFTRAAERLRRTQSAISQQISNLELDLGKPLFVRDTRTMHLTVEGETLIGYARQILSLQQELFSRMQESDLEGEIRLGTPEDFATIYLPEVLSAFAQAYPKIRLNVECDLTLNLLQKFEQGAFDIILAKQIVQGIAPLGVPVWREHLEWVCSERYTPLLTPESLLSLVLAPNPCVYRKRAMEALDGVNIPWRVVYSSPSYAGTVAAVKAGLGMTVLPRTMIPVGLKTMQQPWLPDLANTHIVLLVQQGAASATVTLQDFILQELKKAGTLGR